MANEKMTLGDWLASVGLHESSMAEKAGVSKEFVRAACKGIKGTPMAKAGVMKILAVLSEEHGRTVTLADIQDLKVLGG